MTFSSKLTRVIAVSVAAVVAGLCVTPAGAAVVIFSTDTTADAAITTAGVLPVPTATTGTVRIDFRGNDLDGTIPNSRSPYDGTGSVSTAYYHSVSAGATATYSFLTPQQSFALMWGSPDDYNTLDFFLGATNVGSFDGTEVCSAPCVLQQGFVDVVFRGTFDKVVFGSTGKDAFEFTNIASTPVPIPAAGWLLLTGLAGLGALRRRRSSV